MGGVILLYLVQSAVHDVHSTQFIGLKKNLRNRKDKPLKFCEEDFGFRFEIRGREGCS